MLQHLHNKKRSPQSNPVDMYNLECQGYSGSLNIFVEASLSGSEMELNVINYIGQSNCMHLITLLQSHVIVIV